MTIQRPAKEVALTPIHGNFRRVVIEPVTPNAVGPCPFDRNPEMKPEEAAWLKAVEVRNKAHEAIKALLDSTDDDDGFVELAKRVIVRTQRPTADAKLPNVLIDRNPSNRRLGPILQKFITGWNAFLMRNYETFRTTVHGTDALGQAEYDHLAGFDVPRKWESIEVGFSTEAALDKVDGFVDAFPLANELGLEGMDFSARVAGIAAGEKPQDFPESLTLTPTRRIYTNEDRETLITLVTRLRQNGHSAEFR